MRVSRLHWLLLLCVVLGFGVILFGNTGCGTQTGVPTPGIGSDTMSSGPDGNTRGLDPPAAPPSSTNSNPPVTPPPPPPPPPVYPDYYVLTNRQKVIGLAAWFEGVEYDSIAFSVTSLPSHGQLVGTPPNLTYYPAADYQGLDSFSYSATDGTSVIHRTLTLSVSKTFVPPVGIPAPDFGITQSHWMYAGQTYEFDGRAQPYPDAGNGPYTHYVNFDTGDDQGNTYGDPSRPRKSIPSDLPPGSVVELHGTNIATKMRYTISGNGTADRPIFVRGPSPTQKPVFRRPFSVEGNYIICENLEFDAQDFVTGVIGPIWFWVTSSQQPPYNVFHHIALRHTLIRDQPPDDTANPFGINVGVGINDPSLDDPTKLIENIVVYDVEVRNFAQWDNYNGVADYGGASFMANTRYGWVLDCHFHHIQGDGVGASRSNGLPNQAPARNIYVGRNYLHNFKENCVDYKLCVNSVMSQNVCHTVRQCNSALGQAVPIHDDDQTVDYPGCDNIWIINNTIYDAEVGIYHENEGLLTPGKTSQSYIVGNVVFDIRNIRGNPSNTGVAIQKGQEAQSRIIGNTIWHCDEGIRLGLSGLTRPEQCTQVVRNNLILDLNERLFQTTGQHAMHIFLLPSTIDVYTTIQNNLHYESVGSVRFNIYKPGQQAGNYFTVADMFAATGLGGGSLQVDPQIVSTGTANFHLAAGSPAVGAGLADDVYDIAKQVLGVSINTNLDGRPKATGVYDIGALGVVTGAS